jgi:hypothetical protein
LTWDPTPWLALHYSLDMGKNSACRQRQVVGSAAVVRAADVFLWLFFLTSHISHVSRRCHGHLDIVTITKANAG